MRTPALISALAIGAGPAAGAQMLCAMQDDTCLADCDRMPVSFSIDPAQFDLPAEAGEPPRRHVAMVDMDGARFVADAIRMQGGITGFHEDAEELGARLMIVQPDGAAVLTLRPSGRRLTGSCAAQ